MRRMNAIETAQITAIVRTLPADLRQWLVAVYLERRGHLGD